MLTRLLSRSHPNLNTADRMPELAPMRLLVLTTVVGLAAESIAMLVLWLIEDRIDLNRSLIDIALTVLVVFPVIYILLFRPIKAEIARRRQAELELQQAKAGLESRVKARTAELETANQALQAEIAARKKIEGALLKRESQLRMLIDQIPAFVWQTDHELRFVSFWGSRLTGLGLDRTKMVGYKLDEHTGERIGADNAMYRSHCQALRGVHADYHLNYEGRWYRGYVDPYYEPESKLVGCIGVAFDVTEQKLAEEKIRLLESAFEAAAHGIIITDRSGCICWANPAFLQMTGYTKQEVIGQNPKLLHSGFHEVDFFQSMWDTILAGEVWQGQTTNRRKDGTLYLEEQTITPVLDEAGQVTHFIAIKQEISSRK